VSSAKQKAAAKRNVKKAAAAAKSKKSISHLSKATRTALGIIEWSPELRKLIDGAKDRAAALAEKLGHTAPLHVFTGRYGAPWTQWAVQSQMRRLTASMSIGTSMTYAPRP
jgi:hypothetical protein